MTAGNGSRMLRVRGSNDRVTFIELFFDLVYVFAVTQLSHLLVGNQTWQGAGQTMLILLAVWWAWLNTAWFTNWYDPEQRLVRLVLIGGMLAGLVMSASIPAAFGHSGPAFALGYVVLSVGRNAFAAAFVHDDPPLRRNLQRVLAWTVFSGVFWLAGGLAHGSGRELIWCVAVAIDYGSALLLFYTPGLGRSALEDWTIDGGHLAERCHLVVMIALGESVLLIGSTLSSSAADLSAITAFSVEFVGAVGLWWLYFDRNAGAAGRRITTEQVPGRLARSAYTYVHVALVAGIIVFAVGDHLVIAHPGGHTSWAASLVIVGGPALFLAGHGLFTAQVFERLPVARICGVAALGVLALGTPLLSPLALTFGCVLVIVAVCLADELVSRRAAAPVM